MSDRFIDWLFDTSISVDVQHQELLRGFGVLLLIPFALFLLSYVRVSYFALIKDRARKGALDTVTRVLAAEFVRRSIRVNSIAIPSLQRSI
jgi:NAD(P)-dependent dehydrogenase (short-subunit alcohol dehydrogenase family)